MKRFTTLCFLFISVIAFSAEPYFHSVKVKQGDGVFSLLRRYALLDHDCNKQKFLELNSMNINDPLVQGKLYKLPIRIYEYNGTSIRTTIGIENFDQAVRIQKYNENIQTKGLRKTHYTDSNILWVPYHELSCVSSSIEEKTVVEAAPPLKNLSGEFRQYNYFGPKHKTYKLRSNRLKGEVYYVVSGHGGPDPGAQCTQECNHSVSEDEYAYDVSLRLARYLMSEGATVHVVIQDPNDGIRDSDDLDNDYDETCLGAKIPRNQKLRLRQRASAINKLYSKHKKEGVKKQIAIMIHIDSNNKSKNQDVYFYHHMTSRSSKTLAQSLQNTFKAKYNHFQKGRGYGGYIRGRNLFMLNYTYPTSVYVELANIRNKFDHKRIRDASNREALAKWLFEGLTEAKI